MKLLKQVERPLVFLESKPGLLLLASLILTFLLRLPSLAEPAWYGDEGITFTQAQTIRNGLNLYQDIYDNKPPFSYWLASLSFNLFGPTQWSARAVLMLWVLVSQIALFTLIRKLFRNRIAIIATFIFSLLLSTPYLEGNIYNGEILMILPSTLGFLFGLNGRYRLAGAAFGAAFLFKVPALFDFLAFATFLWLQTKKLYDFELLKKHAFLISGFGSLIVVTSLYFVFNQTFGDYLNSAFFNNVAYTNYYNHFIIPNGLLLLKMAPILGLTVILKFNSKLHNQVNPHLQLVLLWLSFSLYGALLSGRPYTHYLIQAVPAFAVLLGLFLEKVWGGIKEGGLDFKKRSLENKLTFSYLLATIIIVIVGFKPQSIGLDYYFNYIKFINGNLRAEDYQITFDRKVIRNHTLAKFAQGKTGPKDKILVLANEPHIYFLSQRFPPSRYSTFYHLSLVKDGISQLREAVQKQSPKIVFKETADEFNDQLINQILRERYTQTGTFEDVEIYTLKS